MATVEKTISICCQNLSSVLSRVFKHLATFKGCVLFVAAGTLGSAGTNDVNAFAVDVKLFGDCGRQAPLMANRRIELAEQEAVHGISQDRDQHHDGHDQVDVVEVAARLQQLA